MLETKNASTAKISRFILLRNCSFDHIEEKKVTAKNDSMVKIKTTTRFSIVYVNILFINES